MPRFLILALVCLFSACGRQDVLKQAKADFKSRNPQWEIVSAYLGEGDAEHSYVHIRFAHTPAAVFSQQPSIFEMQLGYRKTSDRWELFHESGTLTPK